MKEFKEFYEDQADQDKETEDVFIRLEKAILIANLKQDAKVLDIGCKSAILFKMIAKKEIAVDYYGVDISEKRVFAAQK